VEEVETGCRGIQKTVLDNGIRIVTEKMPHVRSVAVGVWIDAGSRHEKAEENGISHFTEHMVFKGTATRTAEDIACAADAVGGNLDAFTSKESVAYIVKVLDEHLPRAVEMVADMVRHPAFREEDIVREKSVVLEELKMEEDTPEYLLHEAFNAGFWQNHPLGWPIIGSTKTIRGFERQQLQRFFADTYQPRNLMITAAGNVEHPRLVELAERQFGSLKPVRERDEWPAPAAAAAIELRNKPNLEQVHLCLGVPTHPITDPRRYAAYLLNTLLGGGVSSRLFLKVREHEGLAYSIFSDLSLFSDTGCLSVYAGTSLQSVDRVIRHILDEFRAMKEKPVSAEELRRAKDHLKGSLMLSLESTASRMSNLARQEKYFGKFTDLDRLIEKIEGVAAEELLAYARECFQPERVALVALGDLKGYKVTRDQLAC